MGKLKEREPSSMSGFLRALVAGGRMRCAQGEPGAAHALAWADHDVSARQQALEASVEHARAGRSNELRAGDVAYWCSGEQLVSHGRSPSAAAAWQNARQKRLGGWRADDAMGG